MIKTIFNQINKALDGSFSTLAYTSQSELQDFNLNISPWWLTGFVDAEGCFRISVTKNDNYVCGWRVKLYFEIHIHKRDLALLELIQKFFDVGKIYIKNDNSITYLVTSVKDLQVILEHFNKYPLITKKRADFELWAQAFYKIQNKEHSTLDGLMKILAIRATLNKGLTKELKAAFPHIIPMQRPSIYNIIIKDPNWMAGFTSGDGSFMLKIVKKIDRPSGAQVFLLFELSQHARDEQLMKSLIEYFNCGMVIENMEAFQYRVQKFSDIYEKIIPFFSRNRILGVKSQDFIDWCKAAEIINKKAHLTKEGLDQLYKIKKGMNLGRDVS